MQYNQLIGALVYYAIAMLLVIPLLRYTRSPYPLIVFYIASYTVSQYVASKQTIFASFVVPAGVIPFAATLALMDLIVVYYGLSVARQVIFAGFLAQILVYTANYIVLYTPDPFEGFDWKYYVFATSARIAIASPIAYLVTELINAQITWIYRRLWWARTLYSDPIALIIDTFIFIPLAFYGIIPLEVLTTMIIGQTALKLSMIPLNMAVIYINRKLVEPLIRQE